MVCDSAALVYGHERCRGLGLRTLARKRKPLGELETRKIVREKIARPHGFWPNPASPSGTRGRHWAGVAGKAASAIFGHAAGPGQVCQCHQRLDPTGDRETRIGTDIAEDIGVDRQQPTVRVERAVQMKTSTNASRRQETRANHRGD